MSNFSVGGIEVPVEPNADGFGRKLKTQLEVQTEGISVDVEINPELKGLAASLKRQLKEMVTANNIAITVPVKVAIDNAQLKTDLKVLQERINQNDLSVKLGVKIAKADLQAELRQLREMIKAESDIEIALQPVIRKTDLRQALTDLQRQAKAEGVELPVTPTITPAARAAFVAEARAFVLEVSRGLPSLNVDIKANTASAATAGRAISSSLSGPRHEVTELDDNLKKVVKSAGAVVGPLGGAGAQFARLANSGSLAAAAIGGIGVAFAGIIGYGAKVAAEAELADKGITALTKSVGLSGKQTSTFIKQLEQFASVTPFEVPEVKEATKFLLGAGTAVEDILPTLQRITDVGSVLGATTENISNVAKAIAKVQGKGTAQLLELNQIRRNLPGFDPVKAIADFKGQSIADTYAQISKKAIPASLAIEAINQGLEKFPGAAGAAAKASQTLIGLFSTLKDTVAIGFKDAFLQPEVLEPLKGLLRNLIKNSQGQIKEEASALAPIITALGPAVENGIRLFIELTKSAAPFFVEIFNGAAVLEEDLLPAMKDLGPPFLALGEILKALAPAFGAIISLVASGISPFAQLFTVAAKAAAPILETLAKILESLPGPLRSVLGLIILINREQLFKGLVAAGPKVVATLTTVAKVLAGIAQDGFERAIDAAERYSKSTVRIKDDLDVVVKSSATASAAVDASMASMTASATAASTAIATVGTSLATVDSSTFQTARIRGQGALGSGSGLSRLDDVIDVTSVERGLGSGAKIIGEIGPAAEAAATSTSKLGGVLRGISGGLASAAKGAKGFAAGAKDIVTSLGTGWQVAIVAGVALVANSFYQMQRSAEAAKQSGKEFGEIVGAAVNDTATKSVSLRKAYAELLGDDNTQLGKIFANDSFTSALSKRGESIATYANLFSTSSKVANKAFVDLAKTAIENRSILDTIGSSFGSSDLEDGLDRLKAAQKGYVDFIKNVSGPGADQVQKTLKAQEKKLRANNEFQFDAQRKSLDDAQFKAAQDAGLILKDFAPKAAGLHEVLVQVKTDQVDQVKLTQQTADALKQQGISIDFATGEITRYDNATVALANTLDLTLDEVSAFTKQIDAVADSYTAAIDAIQGNDTLKASTEALGGTSMAMLDLLHNGEFTAESIAALATQMGLTGDAAEQFVNDAIDFGTRYVAEINKTKEAFSGLIPTVASVFDELKTQADGVLPTYDELLAGLQKKLEESASINDNIATIIRRGGTGIIETLKTLPAEAQAAYAKAIAESNDKVFIGLEDKSRTLFEEGNAQLQNQGLLAIATVDTAVRANLGQLDAAQKALEDKVKETRAKLSVEANLKPNSPGQRRLLLGDKQDTSTATVAQSASELTAATAGVVNDINNQLATVPAAAKKASDDAVKGLGALPQQLTSATVPGLQSWSGEVITTTDDAASSMGGLAIRGVAAFEALANGLEAPANRILAIIGSIADAINSVTSQIGNGTTIQVPRTVTRPSRPNVDSKAGVHHDGGIVGEAIRTRAANSPLAKNEALVIAEKGEGVIPTDAMKKLGMEQFKFIQKGDVAGLLNAQSKIAGAKDQVGNARSLSPAALDGFSQQVASSLDGAIGNLAKNVTKYLDDVNGLINYKVGTAPGLIPGGNIGGAGSAAAAGWIRAAMALTGVPDSWFVGLMTLAKRESGFNPAAINLWDSNAKAGHPSMGLMQTIMSTFKGNALPGHMNIFNPIDNAIAAIRYILRRYGDISKVQQANPNLSPKGYEEGGLVTYDQLIRAGEKNRKELILPLTNAKRTEDLLAKYLFDPTVSAVKPGSLIDRLEKAAGGKGGAKGAPTIEIGEGGSLIKIETTATSGEGLAAQIGPHALPLVRGILSGS